jgi:quercetin dioxygenase-like cupin family protein
MIVKDATVKKEKLGDGVSRKILAHEGKMMMVKIFFKKGAVGYVHTHPHEQVSYILKGSFEVEIDGEKEILTVGDSFYAGPEVPHGVLALEEAVIMDVFTPQREEFLK